MLCCFDLFYHRKASDALKSVQARRIAGLGEDVVLRLRLDHLPWWCGRNLRRVQVASQVGPGPDHASKAGRDEGGARAVPALELEGDAVRRRATTEVRVAPVRASACSKRKQDTV